MSDKKFDDELELELKSPSNIEAAVKIFVREEVISDITSYSKTDTSRELGGVLLGRYKEINGKYIVLIEETVNAQHTEAGLSKVTFTHETWDHIHYEMDNKYPELKMVGWFHTHPGFGIFMSEDDYFIHNNFFSKPWSVAYVIDPVKKQDGFFGWSNGNIVRIADRHINEVLKKTDTEKQPAYISKTNKTTAIQASIWQRVFSKLIIILLLLSVLCNAYFLLGIDSNFPLRIDITRGVIEETSSNSATNSDYKELKDEIEALKTDKKELKATIEEREAKIEELEAIIRDLEKNTSDSGNSSLDTIEEVEGEAGVTEEETTNSGSDPESNHD